ncbi:MAG: amidohydrolase [Gammaproteobacteria bacterium]|nr:amidohydrolase [Gammaproteobacteria bacterium]
MSKQHAQLLEQAKASFAGVVALRRQLHRFPELGNELPRTRAAVLDYLSDLDLELHLSNATSGIVAVLRGERPGATILLRGDMDALPIPEATGLPFASAIAGRMHACGHDAHTAMLAGAARVLNGRRAGLRGTVSFMFQPGEEGPGGAAPMLEEGLLEAGGKPAAAFGLHVAPNKPSGVIYCKAGTIMASADTMSVRLFGRGGHASMPYDANDPVPVLCEMVQAFQTLVTRRFDPFDPAVVTVGLIRAGTVSNVIAETADMEVTVRSFSDGTRHKLVESLRRVCDGIAAAHDMRVEVSFYDRYPPTVNTPDFAEFVAHTARALVGEDGYEELERPIPGAEDFSFVLQRYGGAFAFLGTCPEDVQPQEAPQCHSNHMRIDEAAMATGVAMHASVVLDFLEAAGPG